MNNNRIDVPARIAQIWDKHTAQIRTQSKGRGSSVLIPLIQTDTDYDVLFEVRSFHIDKQPGEVCLPGGRREPGETPYETAVRETVEELLVADTQIEVIAKLDASPGPGGACIWPFAGVLTGYQNTFSPDEVDHTFRVPFSWFLENEPESYEVEMRTVPGDDFPYERIPHGRDYPWKIGHRNIYFYQYGEYTIWGVTANLIHTFIENYKRNCK